VTDDPTHCPNGHPLAYPNVTVGWTGCGCVRHHRTWTCLTCLAVTCREKVREARP